MILTNFNNYKNLAVSQHYPSEHILTYAQKKEVNRKKAEIVANREETNKPLKTVILEELSLKHSVFSHFSSQELETLVLSLKEIIKDSGRLDKIREQLKCSHTGKDPLKEKLLLDLVGFLTTNPGEDQILENLFSFSKKFCQNNGPFDKKLLGQAMLLVAEKTGNNQTALNLLVFIAGNVSRNQNKCQYINLVLASILGELRLKTNQVVNFSAISGAFSNVTDIAPVGDNCVVLYSNKKMSLFNRGASFSLSKNYSYCLETTNQGVAVYGTAVGKDVIKKYLFNPTTLALINKSEIKLDFSVDSVAYGQCLTVSGQGKTQVIFGEPQSDLKPGYSFVGNNRVKNYEIVGESKILKYADFPWKEPYMTDCHIELDNSNKMKCSDEAVDDVVAKEGVDILPLALRGVMDTVYAENCIDEVMAEAFTRLISQRDQKEHPALFSALRALIEQTEVVSQETIEILKKSLIELPEGREVLKFYFEVDCDVTHLSLEEKVRKHYQLTEEELCQCESDSELVLNEAVRLGGRLRLTSAKNKKIRMIDVLLSNEGDLEELSKIFLQTQSEKIPDCKVIQVPSDCNQTEEFSESGQFYAYPSVSELNCADNIQINDQYLTEFEEKPYEIKKITIKGNSNTPISCSLSENKIVLDESQISSFSLLKSIFDSVKKTFNTCHLDRNTSKIVHSKLMSVVDSTEKTKEFDLITISDGLEKKKFNAQDNTEIMIKTVNTLFLALLKQQNLISDFKSSKDKKLFKQLFTNFEQLRQWLLLRKCLFTSKNTQETKEKVKEDLKMFEERANFLLETVCPGESANSTFEEIEPTIHEILMIFKSTKTPLNTLKQVISENNERTEHLIKALDALTAVLSKTNNISHFSYLYINTIKNGISFSFYKTIGPMSSNNYSRLTEASLRLSTLMFELLLTTEYTQDKIGLTKCLFGTYSVKELVSFLENNYIHRLLDLVPISTLETEFRETVLDLVKHLLIQLFEKQSVLNSDQSNLVKAITKELAARDVDLTIFLAYMGVDFDRIEDLVLIIKEEQDLCTRIKFVDLLIDSLKRIDTAVLSTIVKEMLDETVIPFNLKGDIERLIGEKNAFGLSKGDNVIVDGKITEFSNFSKDSNFFTYPKGDVVLKNGVKVKQEDICLNPGCSGKGTDFTESLPFEIYHKQLAGQSEWNMFVSGSTVSLLNKHAFVELTVSEEIKQGWDKGKFSLEEENIRFKGENQELVFSEQEQVKVVSGFSMLKSYFGEEIENLEERIEKSLSLRGALSRREGVYSEVIRHALREKELLQNNSYFLDALISSYSSKRTFQEVIPFIGKFDQIKAEQIVNNMNFTALTVEEKAKSLCEHITKLTNQITKLICQKLLTMVSESDWRGEEVIETAIKIDLNPTLAPVELNFIEFARTCNFALKKQDLSLTNPDLKAFVSKKDLLITEFTEENVTKLMNTQSVDSLKVVTNNKLEFKYGNTDSSKLTLIPVKVPSKGNISFNKLKIDESILVFKDKEGKKLLDVFSYNDQLKETIVDQGVVYVSLPLKGLKTKVTKIKNTGETIDFPELANSSLIWSSDNGMAALKNKRFLSNYEIFEGEEEDKFTEELAKKINELGDPKHLAVNGRRIALINNKNELFLFNQTSFGDTDHDYDCFAGPVDISSYGEIEHIAVGCANLLLTNTNGDLFMHGEEMGEVFPKAVEDDLVQIAYPEGKILGIYCQSYQNNGEEEVFFVLIENEDREIFAFTRGSMAVFPKSFGEWSPFDFKTDFRWVKTGFNHSMLFDRNGKIHLEGDYDFFGKESIDKGNEQPRELLENREIIDHCSVIGSSNTATIFKGEKGNCLELKTDGGVTDVSFNGTYPTQLVVKGEDFWVLSVDIDVEQEELKEGNQVFTVYFSSFESKIDFDFLYKIEKDHLIALLSLISKEKGLEEEKASQIAAMNSEQKAFLEYFLKEKLEEIQNVFVSQSLSSRGLKPNLELLSHSKKTELFSKYIEAVSKKINYYGPEILLDRKLAVKCLKSDYLDTKDRTILSQLQTTNNEKPLAWFDSEVFKAKLKGESKKDYEISRKQVFSQISSELMSNVLDLLVPSPNLLGNCGECKETWIVNPNSQNPDKLLFLGKLIVNCLSSESILAIDLNPVVWKSIRREAFTREDIKFVDIQSYDLLNNLEKSDFDKNTLYKINEGKFKVNSIAGEEIIIKDEELTMDNLKEYIAAVEEFKLKELEDQGKLILEGIEWFFN